MLTRTGAEKVAPPSVDLVSSIWLWLSAAELVLLLKLAHVTYRAPSGPVKGSENWFELQRPLGVGSPNVVGQSALSALTRIGALKDSP